MVNRRGKPPQLDERIQFLWRQVVDPCDAPITVWAEALWPAARDLFLAWFALDWKQILLAAFRPGKARRGPRSVSHLSRMLKGKRFPWKRFFGKIIEFDPNTFIGELIDYVDDVRGRDVGSKLEFLWIIEGIIERIFFWWMVLDLVTEFFWRWSSVVGQTKYCQESRAAVLLAEGVDLGTIGFNIWIGSIFSNTRKARNLTFWNGNGVVQDVGYGVCAYSATATTQIPGTEGTVGIRLTVYRNGFPVASAEKELFVPVGESIEVGCSVRVQPGDAVIAEDRSNGTRFILEPSYLYLHATENGAQ